MVLIFIYILINCNSNIVSNLKKKDKPYKVMNSEQYLTRNLKKK